MSFVYGVSGILNVGLIKQKQFSSLVFGKTFFYVSWLFILGDDLPGGQIRMFTTMVFHPSLRLLAVTHAAVGVGRLLNVSMVIYRGKGS